MAKKAFNGNTAIVLLVTISLLVLLHSFSSSKNLKLEEEAVYVADQLTSENPTPFAIAEKGRVIDNKVIELDQMPYDELKEKLGVSNDFCIYLEDDDGTPIRISNNVGIGSEKIRVEGERCT